MKGNSLRHKFAVTISEIFSPFILTGILTTVIACATDSRPLLPASLALIFITLIPQGLSIYLHRSKKTTDRFIAVRQQRTPFYLATLASIALGAISVNFAETTHEVRTVLNLALATIVAVLVINLRIKISIHALIGIAFAILLPLYLPHPVLMYPACLLMWALTTWSRKALNRHSTPELALGTIFGVLLSGIYILLV